MDVATGEGKGWAKGRSAASDPRIARAAAAHRGLTYAAHVGRDQDRRRRIREPFVAAWTPTLAYAVGLLATDGGLSRGRSVSFPSADRELVEILLHCLQKGNRISAVRTRAGGVMYRTQIGDAALHRWLVGIGITPRKSLTIKDVRVPDDLFMPFTRGLLDGDGSIMNKVARADTGRRQDYYWEYLQTRFVSASREHLVWLRRKLKEHVGVDGLIILRKARGRRHDCYTLRYSKLDSHRLLPAVYADKRVPRLTRKWRIWAMYLQRHPDVARVAKIGIRAQVVKR